MTLLKFNKIYKYQSDKEKYGTSLDIWELPKVVDGRVLSDCESAMRFLKNHIEEFKDWEYYYCRIKNTNGEMGGHCFLYKNGNVIDCNIKMVVTLEHYSRIFTVTDIKKYNWFVVGCKIVFARVYTWIF